LSAGKNRPTTIFIGRRQIFVGRFVG